ncbi:hypothetical protein H072_10083 [Dactylellina haptotyla CBS 200.50]|uniref:Uncharacterized protein n=1 Tax=Dactylellina haptotyla (strain CBS 200.50) TaxID=1284197 RepID=S8BMH5_DACHA|nr:hypothetical protein H072_10083 [Dactylellina haptotyla CBS 200.50]
MVYTTRTVLLLIGIGVATSVPVPLPPNELQKVSSSGGSHGPKLKFSQPLSNIGEPSPADISARETSESISIPSVNEEKSGRIWMQNIAGPSLDTFSSSQKLDVKALPPRKQPLKHPGQLMNPKFPSRLKTAHEDPEEHEETDSWEQMGDEMGDNWGYLQPQDEEDEQLTAQFKSRRDNYEDFSDKVDGIELRFDDEEVSGYDDRDNNFNYGQNGPVEYDPVRDPFFGDYPRQSPLRNTLRKLLRKPLYPKLGGPISTSSRIKPTDSSMEAVEKMWRNVQPIQERGSTMEQTTILQSSNRLQSTNRGLEGLPRLPAKLRVQNPKFLPQGMESLQSPSIVQISQRPSSRVASLLNDNYTYQDGSMASDRDQSTLTLMGLDPTRVNPPGKNSRKVPNIW